jgi:hypothetical protein
MQVQTVLGTILLRFGRVTQSDNLRIKVSKMLYARLPIASRSHEIVPRFRQPSLILHVVPNMKVFLDERSHLLLL